MHSNWQSVTRTIVNIIFIVLMAAVLQSCQTPPPAPTQLDKATANAIALCSQGLEQGYSARVRAAYDKAGGKIGGEIKKIDSGTTIPGLSGAEELERYKEYLKCIDKERGRQTGQVELQQPETNLRFMATLDPLPEGRILRDGTTGRLPITFRFSPLVVDTNQSVHIFLGFSSIYDDDGIPAGSILGPSKEKCTTPCIVAMPWNWSDKPKIMRLGAPTNAITHTWNADIPQKAIN